MSNIFKGTAEDIQPRLKAGSHVNIATDNTISVTGFQEPLTAGEHISISDNTISVTDIDSSDVVLVMDYASLSQLEENQLAYVPTGEHKGLYIYQNETLYTVRDADSHTHTNKSVLDNISYSTELTYNGRTILLSPVDDVQLLEQTTYERLYLCTEGAVPVLENIPTELTGTYFLYRLDDVENYIQIGESINSETGLPMRMLTVHLDGENYTYLSDDGWQDSNFDPCDAPVITNFTVQSIRCYNTVYDDFSDLSAEAQSALKLLSQIVHISPDRVDHPYFSEDAVLRYAGTIEPNRKYAFITTYAVFDLTLPTVPFQAEDAQFVLYLTCNSAIGGDVGFPAGTMIIGGQMSIEQGVNKIIGTWNRDEGCWMVGCVTAEAVE